MFSVRANLSIGFKWLGKKDGNIGHLGDGGNVIFFNCSYKGEDDYATLAHDMLEPDHRKIVFAPLRDTVKRAKIKSEGEQDMQGLTKSIYNSGYRAGRESAIKKTEKRIIQIAEQMIRSGKMELPEIAEATGLSLEEVKAISDSLRS